MKPIKHGATALLCASLTILPVLSCSLFETTVPVRISPPGEGIHPLELALPITGWRVRYANRDTSGTLQLAGRATVTLDCPRETITAVTFSPLLSSGEELIYPAGMVLYPDKGHDRETVTWQGGWIADLALRLIKQKADPDRFNFLRLQRTLNREEYSDPWRIDRTGLGTAFSDETFTMNSLTLCPLFTYKGSTLPPGPALPENPFSDPLFIPETGELSLLLPPGCHRYWLQEHNQWLVITISENGVGAEVLTPMQGP